MPSGAGGLQRGHVQSATSSGAGVQHLGAALEHVGEQLGHQAKVEEARINTLRAEDAYNQVQNKALDLAYGDKGYTTIQGADAVSKPIRIDYSKRFDDAVSEISATLTNDEQRSQFQHRVGVGRLKFQEGILHHLAKQGDVYAKQVFDGTVTTSKRDAVAGWDNPREVDSALLRVDNAIAEYADREGWPKEMRDAQRRIKHGEIHSEVIGQAIATGNYRYAQAWFEAHKEDVDVATAKSLELNVRNGAQKERAATYRADYLANENSPQVLENLRGRVLKDGELDDDRRNVLVGMIQNRQAVLENRSRVEYDKRVRTIERGINELNSNTLAGFEPSPEQFAPYITMTKGTELEPQVQAAISLANATRAFRNQPPQAQERLLAEAEAGIRQDPTKFDRKVVGAWRTIYDNQRSAVKESPVSFAVQQGIIAPPAPLDLSNPAQQGTAEGLAQRFQIARGMQTFYQAPFKPLTPAETKVVTSALKGAGPSQKAAYFGQLAQAAGNDHEGYSAIMAQIAPDDPVTAVAGQYQFRGRTQAADLMLRGQAMLHPNRKEDGSPDKGKLWPMPPDAELTKGFNSYEKDAFAGHPQARNAVFQAAQAIYAAKSSDEGDGSGVINSSRWDESIKLASGGIEKWNGKGTVLPYGFTMGQFKDGLSQRIKVMDERGQLNEGTTRDKLYDMPLEAVGDGRYVFRSGDGILLGKDKKPLVADFNQGLPFRSSGERAGLPGPARATEPFTTSGGNSPPSSIFPIVPPYDNNLPGGGPVKQPSNAPVMPPAAAPRKKTGGFSDNLQ